MDDGIGERLDGGNGDGMGKRADHENNLLDNLHEKGYYPPSK